MKRNAIVTLVTGKQYVDNFKKNCYANWRKYADHHDLDLCILEHLPDLSQRGLSRSPAWQKCLVLSGDEAKRYQQVAWVDADIVMNASAPNIFDNIQADEVGAVMDFMYPTPESYKARLQRLYQHWSAQGISVVENLTPEKFLENWGLPPLSHVVQTGVLVVNPAVHGSLLQRT